MEQLSEEMARRLLRGHIKYGTTQAELAEKIGISRAYLCEILAGKKPLGDKVLEFLKIDKIFVKR